MKRKLKISTPATGKREMVKAQNRQAILGAGRRVFAQMGYEAANVRDIVRESGLAAGTFYNYFKSKSEVSDAIASDFADRFSGKIQSIRHDAKSLEAYVFATYKAYFDLLIDENQNALELGVSYLSLFGTRPDSPEVLAIGKEIFRDLTSFLDGRSDSEMDIEMFATAAIAMGRDLGVRMLARKPIDSAKTAKFASELLIGGAKRLGVSK